MNRRAPRLIGIALLAVLLSATACGDSDATSTPSSPTSTAAVASPTAASTAGPFPRIPFTLTPSEPPDPLPPPERLAAWEDIPDAITSASLPLPGVAILQSGGTTLAVDTASGAVRSIAALPPEVPWERYNNVQFDPSPEGTRFAFTCDDGGAWTHARAANLCMAAPGVPATIVASASALTPGAAIKRDSGYGVTLVWSPDGRRIAFQAYVETGTPQRTAARAEIYVTDLDSGLTARIVENDSTESYVSISWSPDSQRLALLSDFNGVGYTSIVIIDAETRETVRVAANVGYLIAISGVNWAPDSVAIAFFASSAREPGAASVYVADLNDGSVTHLLATVMSQPVWSPDGTWIAVTRYLGQRSQFDPITRLYVVRRDGSEVRELSDQLAGVRPPYAWAPENERLIARGSATSEIGLYLVDINGSTPVLVAADARSDPSSPYGEYTFWSRDGRLLYYTHGGGCMKGWCAPGHIFTLDLATNTSTQLHDAPIDRILHPAR